MEVVEADIRLPVCKAGKETGLCVQRIVQLGVDIGGVRRRRAAVADFIGEPARRCRRALAALYGVASIARAGDLQNDRIVRGKAGHVLVAGGQDDSQTVLPAVAVTRLGDVSLSIVEAAQISQAIFFLGRHLGQDIDHAADRFAAVERR